MAELYKLVAPVTLGGIPAGPDIEDNYLEFVEGDVVTIVSSESWNHSAEGAVTVRKIGRLLEQELDRSSLEAI